MKRMKILWLKKRVACALVTFAMMMFQTTVPVSAATMLDPHNPSNFQKEGGQSHTPGDVLTLTDTSISDFVSFFAADSDANPGIDIDIVTTFQIRQTQRNNADTGNRIVISDGVSRSAIATCVGFAASPTGAKIAFTSTRDGNSEIYSMNADGTGVLRLTNHAKIDGNPAWSPDGAKIAFMSTRPGNAEIYVMNAIGTGLTRLTTNSAIDAEPAWNSNGKIAFSSTRDGKPDHHHQGRPSVHRWGSSCHTFGERRDRFCRQ